MKPMESIFTTRFQFFEWKGFLRLIRSTLIIFIVYSHDMSHCNRASPPGLHGFRSHGRVKWSRHQSCSFFSFLLSSRLSVIHWGQRNWWTSGSFRWEPKLLYVIRHEDWLCWMRILAKEGSVASLQLLCFVLIIVWMVCFFCTYSQRAFCLLWSWH